MISEETNKLHEKHAKLSRPNLGEFGRNEVAIVGTTCVNIKSLAYSIIQKLSAFKIAYADADHKGGNDTENSVNTALTNGGFLEYTDKITFQRVEFKNEITSFQKRMLFNEQDLVIVNGNHFSAKCQVVVIDPVKDLEKKQDQLTDVRLIILKETDAAIPGFLQRLPAFDSIPILCLNDENGIADFIQAFLAESRAPLHGLVLSGGLSSRMKKDKGNLDYHGSSQREHVYRLLSKFCEKTFISCNALQAEEIANSLPVIRDSFLNLGPTGGILSALQTNPNAAWLTVACDLPYLSEKTIQYLADNRNPSKTATAFLDPQGEFPEPLITIWEPKSYSILLQFLSQGYSCPRKVLINSDIELLKARDAKEFVNVNLPQEYEQAVRDLKTK